MTSTFSTNEGPAAEVVPATVEAAGFVPRCPHCDYILLGLTVERCPECGRRFSLAQLRQMQMRRKPTPWEAPSIDRSAAARFLATWRAMLRPAFFLFLARPERGRRAVLFLAVSTVWVTALWAGVMALVSSTEGARNIVYYILEIPPALATSGRGGRWSGSIRGAEMICLVAAAAAFVPTSVAIFAFLLRLILGLSGPEIQSGLSRAVCTQVSGYLSCWLLGGLILFALGVLAMIPFAQPWRPSPLFIPADWILVPTALFEVMFVTVWACQADAAMRDGLSRRSPWAGPMLVVFLTLTSVVLATLISGQVMGAVAAAFE